MTYLFDLAITTPGDDFNAEIKARVGLCAPALKTMAMKYEKAACLCRLFALKIEKTGPDRIKVQGNDGFIEVQGDEQIMKELMSQSYVVSDDPEEESYPQQMELFCEEREA